MGVSLLSRVSSKPYIKSSNNTFLHFVLVYIDGLKIATGSQGNNTSKINTSFTLIRRPQWSGSGSNIHKLQFFFNFRWHSSNLNYLSPHPSNFSNDFAFQCHKRNMPMTPHFKIPGSATKDGSK